MQSAVRSTARGCADFARSVSEGSLPARLLREPIIMPTIDGRLVTLRAATKADFLALEPIYATIRDVAYLTRAAPRPDHVEKDAEDLATPLAEVTPTSEVHFAIIDKADGKFCGVMDVYNIHAHHRSVRRGMLDGS